MTSAEKFQAVLDLKPVKDRRDIPIYPMMLTYPGVVAGMTQKEITTDINKWISATSQVFEKIGKPDVWQCNYAGDVMFVMGLKALRPGFELDDNALYQFDEKPRMTVDDYHKILKMGWNNWYNQYLGTIQPKPVGKFRIIMRWIKLGMNSGKVTKFLRANGVEPIADTATGPVFDTLSMVRSFEEFCYDLADEPELIQDVLAKGTGEAIDLAITNAKRATGKRIGIYAMRSDMNSISPAIFDEFAFPQLKRQVEAFHAAGMKSIIHADGQWLPVLDRFLALPKGSCHFEFDGVTDIYKAYEILHGHHSMRGDVPATMLAFGTPDEVREYCEKLVTELGMRGGFMLGSGCEVPLNAKPENVKAMFAAVR